MEHTNLELYIQIRNGQPHEHPIFADNFRQAFPDVDTENLPDTFANDASVSSLPQSRVKWQLNSRFV